MHVLLTGGTGFVGAELARTLLAQHDLTRLYLVVRPRAGISAAERVKKTVQHWAKFGLAALPRDVAKIHLIDHDLSSGQLQVPSPVDYVIHSAASTDLGAPLDLSRRANLFATQRVLDAARKSPKLKRFVHLSTAYVCGKTRGPVAVDTPAPSRFHNFYEQSKFEAEQCVRASGLPWTIVRPSMIVGRSDNGYVVQMKVLYSVLRLWASGMLPVAPFDLKAWVDIIPVDYVVDGTLAAMRRAIAEGKTLHFCAGEDRQRCGTLMLCAKTVFPNKIPPMLPIWIAALHTKKPFNSTLPHRLRELLHIMFWHLPYLSMRDRIYDMSQTDELLGAMGIERPKFANYGTTLFKFCKDTAWGKRDLNQARENADRLIAIGS